jgi:mediator of RNA polymerase II transcription subunit 5
MLVISSFIVNDTDYSATIVSRMVLPEPHLWVACACLPRNIEGRPAASTSFVPSHTSYAFALSLSPSARLLSLYTNMDSMLKEWTVFLDRYLKNRVQPNLFAAAVAQLHAKYPLPGPKLAALLLRPRTAGASSIDPRTVLFLEQLLALRKVDASDVLTVAFLCSKDRLPKTGETNPPKNTQWNNPPELEEIVFHRLHKAFASGERPVNNTEGLRTLLVVTRWMQVMVTSHTSDTMIQAMAGIQQPQQQSISVREGLAMLVVGVIENPKILWILNNPKSKGKRVLLSRHVSRVSRTSTNSCKSHELSLTHT